MNRAWNARIWHSSHALTQLCVNITQYWPFQWIINANKLISMHVLGSSQNIDIRYWTKLLSFGDGGREGKVDAVSSVVGHRYFTILTFAPPHFVRAHGENDRTISFFVLRFVLQKWRHRIKCFAKLQFLDHQKWLTYFFKNPTSEYEKIVNKDWEKNIIENLGLNKNEICKKTQAINGTLKSKPEAISEYLKKDFNNPVKRTNNNSSNNTDISSKIELPVVA